MGRQSLKSQAQAQQLIPPETTDQLVATRAIEVPAVMSAGMGLFEVPIESISPNPYQPRQGMQVDRLEELAD